MLNRFSQVKYEESRKHELLEQKKEEDNKGYNARTELCQKQEFLDRIIAVLTGSCLIFIVDGLYLD